MSHRNATRTLALSLLALAVLWATLANAQTQRQPQGRPLLLTPTDRAGSVEAKPDPTVIRSQNVTVNIQLLRSKDNGRLSIPLIDGTRLVLIRDRQEQVPKNGLVWYGKVAEQPQSVVILSLIGESLIGNITTQARKIYQVRYIGNGVHSLREIDQSRFPQEGQPIKPDQRAPGQPAADTCATDPPTDIDVMVVYTSAARTGAGGTDAMEASAFLAVAETNQSYINSNITQRLRLAHVEEVTYTESGNINTDLSRLQNGSDGFMDNVQTLRNTFAADTVVLITENGGGFCGLGYMMQTVSNTFESNAYCVVARSCATGYYSFGHELGHNMGADHDPPNANSTGPYPYNRGFSNTSPSSPATPWRTIMSYNTTPSSTRVQYWSNPNVNYPIPGTDAMGNSSPSDNHRVLNNTALTVANFRCSSPSAGNVWMKDTWNDTGAEPDAHTASEDMWKSPYIWVRNSQDTNLIHQHEHQNPEFGSPNFVYAKLHNGGNTTANGNLEFYYAIAASGLSWQVNWTLVASIPVTSFAAHSTKVVEAQWNPPQTGHICMIARWVSAADPMTFAETTDINGNVRNNNNIVWRNLNVVDILPDMGGDVSFIVRNVDKESAVFSLVIRSPQNEVENSFIRYGQVIVRLDDGLMKAWRQGGSKGLGFKRQHDKFIVTEATGAVFQNVVMGRGMVGQVYLTFKRLPTTPRRSFIIDAVQLRSRVASPYSSKRPEPAIGGVSYEIHTDVSEKQK